MGINLATTEDTGDTAVKSCIQLGFFLRVRRVLRVS
jgi:hypothetical protein